MICGRRHGTILLLLGLSLACGDDETGTDTLPGPYNEVFDAVCGAMDRCPDIVGRPIAYRDRSECIAIIQFALTCRLTETDLGDFSSYSIEQRAPALDEEAANACIAWMQSASCTEIKRGGEDTPCSNVLSLADDNNDSGDFGPGRVGDQCSGDYDCARELYCVDEHVDSMTGVQTCSGCVARKSFGEECSSQTRECEEGLFCRREVEGPRRCALLEPNGVECFEHEQCESGFCNYTDPNELGQGVCDPGGQEGSSCDEAGDCRQGFYCNTTCQSKRKNGQSCSSSEECEFGNCDEGTSICGAPDGTPCSGSYECASGGCNDSVCGPASGGSGCGSDEDCPAGLVCVFSSGTCEAPRDDGTMCDRDEECASLFCNFDDVCATPPKLGDPCEDTFECPPTGYCSGGSCIQRLGPGEACTGFDSCLEPFLCLEGTCEIINLACRPAHAGEQCALLRVCDDQSYCDLLDNVTCKARGALGEPCSESIVTTRLGYEVCLDGLRCDSGSGTCVTKAAKGEPCSGPRDCVEGNWCVDGTCVADPLGRPCDSYDAPCPAGLFCSDDDTCRTPGGEGARCRESVECQDGFYCDSPFCMQKKPQGADCRDLEECQEPFYCNQDTDTCEPDLTAGTSCDSRWGECGTGLWCPNATSDPVCEPQAQPGEDCDRSEQCTSGVCYQSSFCLASAVCTPPG